MTYGVVADDTRFWAAWASHLDVMVADVRRTLAERAGLSINLKKSKWSSAQQAPHGAFKELAAFQFLPPRDSLKIL